MKKLVEKNSAVLVSLVNSEPRLGLSCLYRRTDRQVWDTRMNEWEKHGRSEIRKQRRNPAVFSPHSNQSPLIFDALYDKTTPHEQERPSAAAVPRQHANTDTHMTNTQADAHTQRGDTACLLHVASLPCMGPLKRGAPGDPFAKPSSECEQR